METIVLVGGFGTRLQSVVSDVPKPMAPINEKPFLEYVLNNLKKYSINKVILAVGYKKEVIKEYFDSGFNGMRIIYSEEIEPLGTGGAIKQALKLANNDNVYVLNGDTFFDFDVRKMCLTNSDIQIALKPMQDFDRYGSVKIDANGVIREFCEKKYTKSGLINTGVYLIKKTLFDGYDLGVPFSFEKFLEENLSKLQIETIIDNGYFVDIGIPQDYYKFQEKQLDI